MVDLKRLCLGCMRVKPTTESVCPYCGFNDIEAYGEQTKRCIPIRTVLEGKYLIGRVLGEGGFGITYLAWELTSNHIVAVKEYFPANLAERVHTAANPLTVRVRRQNDVRYYRKGLEGFQREVLNLSQCQNLPGVVRILDYFEKNNTAYLVMNYVNGITLKECLMQRGAPFPEQELLMILRPVIESLEVVHKRGLIHRDITPDNILVDRLKRATLIDFGSARDAAINEDMERTVMLKHGYAPFEQYTSRGNQGPWTDVYALCATMYYLLSGILPQDAAGRYAQDRVKPLAVLANERKLYVSERTSAAIQKGMSPKIQDRYLGMSALYKDLYGERLKENIPVQSDRPRRSLDTADGKGTLEPKDGKQAGSDRDTYSTEQGYTGYIVCGIIILVLFLIIVWYL